MPARVHECVIVFQAFFFMLTLIGDWRCSLSPYGIDSWLWLAGASMVREIRVEGVSVSYPR